MNLSIIIPIYNETLNLNKLYDRLLSVLEPLKLSFELVFINDGSKDNSIQIIRTFSQKDNRVKFIHFSRNFGHQIAVQAGLDLCVGEAAIIIDADLQDPPELIVYLYKKYKEGFEVVYAKRRSRKGESYFKKLTAKMFYRLLSKITSIDIPVDTGDFRIIDRQVINVLKEMPEQNKYLRGQISWLGFNQTFVEYDRDERYAGETGYTFRKMFRLAMDGITSFSNLPLKFASITGFVVSGISFIVMLYALYSNFVLKRAVEGWTSIMISVLFLGGVQLICLGIIGEYISRLNQNVRNRPLYIIQQTNIEKTPSNS